MTESKEQFEFDFENVKAQIFRESQDEIKLQMGEFEGPLGLLLYLIKREEANIFDIPIARITDEYLRHIKLLKQFDVAVAADFLVMAATLIEIKSKMLLPQESTLECDEEIEDPRQELVDRLLEHQKFKNAAEMLWSRATVERAIFTRGRIKLDADNPEINVTIFNLFETFQKIVERHREKVQIKIEREEMTLSEMMRNIKLRLNSGKSLNLLKMFERMETRKEMVLAFISVLEIVRTESIKLIQRKTFGDVILKLDGLKNP